MKRKEQLSDDHVREDFHASKIQFDSGIVTCQIDRQLLLQNAQLLEILGG